MTYLSQFSELIASFVELYGSSVALTYTYPTQLTAWKRPDGSGEPDPHVCGGQAGGRGTLVLLHVTSGIPQVCLFQDSKSRSSRAS